MMLSAWLLKKKRQNCRSRASTIWVFLDFLAVFTFHPELQCNTSSPFISQSHGNSAPVLNGITTWIEVNHFHRFKHNVCKSFWTLQEFLTMNFHERIRLIQKIGRNCRHSLSFGSLLPYRGKFPFKVYYVRFQGAKYNHFRWCAIAENWCFSILLSTS